MAKHATSPEIIRINDKLKTVLRKTENGYCTYIDRNITDATVAKELGTLEASVARIRKENYGLLQTAQGGRASVLQSRIAELEARIAELEKAAEARDAQIVEMFRQFVDYREHFIKLCEVISMKQLADVRYLAKFDAAVSNGAQQATRR